MDTNLMTLTAKPPLNNEYLFYALLHIQLWRIADTTSIPQINNKHINPLIVTIPPVEEQRAIATALSDVDELVGALNRLIAKKRDLKQAAVQQLLTGKTRLRGFPGEWEVKRFGELASPRRDSIDRRNTAPHAFCIELEHIEQETGRLLGNASTREQSSLKSRFYVGDVLFGKVCAYLRKYWLADREGVCSTEIWALTPNLRFVGSEFLFQLVRVDRFVHTANTAYGTHMPRSDWNVVRNYEVAIPPLDEQTAIVAILSDMDAEISALERRRDKTHALKQAMMQELLTGRTRLI
jgi:type I restriction enzyme S subunit